MARSVDGDGGSLHLPRTAKEDFAITSGSHSILRFALSLLILFGCLSPQPSGAQGADRAREYAVARKECNLGLAISECLALGAIVFTGTIKNLGEPWRPAGVPTANATTFRHVDVTVDEWLGQTKLPSKQVRLLHATRPANARLDTGFWLLWENVVIARGTKLLVLLRRSASLRDAGAPLKAWQHIVVVASDPKLVSRIRGLVSRFSAFKSNPALLTQVKTSLVKSNTDSLFAGFFVGYLMYAEPTRDRDRAASLLVSLLRAGRLPRGTELSVCSWLGTNCGWLSQATRGKMFPELLSVAIGKEEHLYMRVISSLVVLRKRPDLGSALASLTPEDRVKLIQNYRNYKRKLRGNRASVETDEFEALLGIRAEAPSSN